MSHIMKKRCCLRLWPTGLNTWCDLFGGFIRACKSSPFLRIKREEESRSDKRFSDEIYLRDVCPWSTSEIFCVKSVCCWIRNFLNVMSIINPCVHSSVGMFNTSFPVHSSDVEWIIEMSRGFFTSWLCLNREVSWISTWIWGFIHPLRVRILPESVGISLSSSLTSLSANRPEETTSSISKLFPSYLLYRE